MDRGSRHGVWRAECPWNPPGGSIDIDTPFCGVDNYLNWFGTEENLRPSSPKAEAWRGVQDLTWGAEGGHCQSPGNVITTHGSWADGAAYNMTVRLDLILNDWLKRVSNNTLTDWRQKEVQDRFKFFYNLYGVDKVGIIRSEAHGTQTTSTTPWTNEVVHPTFALVPYGPSKWIAKRISNPARYTFTVLQTNPNATAGEVIEITRVDWNLNGEPRTSVNPSESKDMVWYQPTPEGSPTSVSASATVYYTVHWTKTVTEWLVVIGNTTTVTPTTTQFEEHTPGGPVYCGQVSVPVEVYSTEIVEF